MYNRIKQEIQEPYYRQNFSNDGQRFVAWYLRNIHLRDMNETKADVTDGPNDKQIDAIVVDDQTSTVYIIQGKFIGSDSSVDSEPLQEVLSSWVHLKDLTQLQATSNHKLQQKLSEVAIAFRDEYDVEFELITTSVLTQGAKEVLARFQREIAESDDFSAVIHLIDIHELQIRYDMALQRENPCLNHSLILENGKYMNMKLSDTNVVIAAVPLKKCIDFPGIKDQTLFQKNVRQSLGLSNRVNKGILRTIYDSPDEFFFYHNGLTAICNQLVLEDNGRLTLKGVSIVNGCQSMNTILSCSEQIKENGDAHVLFRFYEIPRRERADKISTSTNSQSAVKPRDLRSNDKHVLALKRQYELKYPQGYFITKRGEVAPADRDNTYVIDLSDLGKYMISWHSQRPNIAYSETKLFDKYFEQLFKREYSPSKIQALNEWMQKVNTRWAKENPLGLNESLLAMKSYAPYHHLYAISLCFCVSNKMPEGIPDPQIALDKALSGGLSDQIVDMAGTCLNSALVAAANEQQPANRVFSPQNWIKTKTCLAGIRMAISQYFGMLPSLPQGKELHQRLSNALSMKAKQFEARWTAD